MITLSRTHNENRSFLDYSRRTLHTRRRIALGMIACSGGRAQGDPITGIVSFGDSLSDVGNDYIGSGGTQPAPVADYYQGRFQREELAGLSRP